MGGESRISGRTVAEVLNFVVAVVAVIFAVIAWNRPIPSDPRAVPNLGSGQEPYALESDGGRRLFEFLNENEGRLVWIVATVSSTSDAAEVVTKPKKAGEGYSILVPGWDCNQPHSEPTEDCSSYLLQLSAKSGATGLSYDSGVWELRGYFADEGYLDSAAWIDYYQAQRVDLQDAVT